MSEQETYSPQGNTPASTSPATLPNEDYYQRAPAPTRGGRNVGLGIALVIIGVLLLGGQLVGQMIGKGGSYSLVNQDVPGNRLELSVNSSDVEVYHWNGDTIRIEATQHGGSRGDYQVKVERNGDTINVTENSSSFFCWFCSRNVSYRISMPETAQADIRTTSGDITIEGLQGAVTLATVNGEVSADELTGGLKVATTSGEVRLTNIAGKLEVKTISGDVQLGDGQVTDATISSTSGEVNLDGVGGPVQIDTVSGDINVNHARDAQLTLSTTSGDVEYDGSLQNKGTNKVNTISGDVQLDLPGDSAFQLNASTVSGDVSNDFASSTEQSPGNTAGNDGTTLTVETTSGDITISKR